MSDSIAVLIHELDDDTTEKTEVLVSVESAGQSEFFAAQQTGVWASFKLSLWMSDYDGQRKCLFCGKEYIIYRTFIRKDGKIELYLGERVGA